MANGRFMVSSGEQSVKESIYLILMTQKEERPLRPNFGSDIMSYTFLDVGGNMLNMIIRTIKDQILSQEPRVMSVDVRVDESSRDGVILFDISYTIRETNVRDNLVFPFYMNAENEPEEEEPEEYEPETFEEAES